jgi:DegV family protein with EDD domain
MSKVAIVTDSTATIPDSLIRNLPVSVVPLQVIWGTQNYRDGVDIHSSDFYSRLKNASVLPTTSQPAPSVFQETFQKLLDSGYDVLAITISSRLSGTYDSALQAKNSLHTKTIEVIDSLAASMALGFQVLSVARAASEGATLAECKTLAARARENSGVLFVLNTLEYLHKGGRIGGAAAFFGTMLNLKPILELRDGKIEAVDKVRTQAKAIDRMLEIFESKVQKRSPVRLAGLYADTPEEAEALLERARQKFNISIVNDAITSEVSPVLGTHTGPGCLGIAYMAGL